MIRSDHCCQIRLPVSNPHHNQPRGSPITTHSLIGSAMIQIHLTAGPSPSERAYLSEYTSTFSFISLLTPPASPIWLPKETSMNCLGLCAFKALPALRTAALIRPRSSHYFSVGMWRAVYTDLFTDPLILGPFPLRGPASACRRQFVYSLESR